MGGSFFYRKMLCIARNKQVSVFPLASVVCRHCA